MRPSTHAVIVGGGEPPSRELLEKMLTGQPCPLLLCADGGANVVAEYGFTPDAIVGDLDSVGDGATTSISCEGVIAIAEQETTDLEKVLTYAESLGVRAANLLGFTGRRTDHTLWNLSLIKTFADRIALCLVDDYCEIRRVGSRLRFCADLGQKLSLCPLDGPAYNVSTSGLRWPLYRESLIPGKKNGISNEVLSSPVEVVVGVGEVLLCVLKDTESRSIEVLQ